MRTVALIGADRSLHGAGAGVAAAGVVAVVTERRTRTQAPNGVPRVLAAAAGHWALVAAVVTGAVAVAMACTPVLGAGGIPDHG